MRVKGIYIVLIVSLSAALMAQSPGYMGKKFTLGYGFNFSPITFGTSYSGKTLIGRGGSAEKGKLVFNAIHEAYFEYATSKRFIVGASARFFRTQYDNRREVYNTGATYLSYKPANYYNIKGTTLTPYFKIFRRVAVAPWGRYFLLGLAINNVHTSYDPYMYLSGSTMGHDTLVSDFGPNKQKQVMLDLLVGWGRTRVVANRVTIDYGFNFQPFSMLVPVKDFLLLNNRPALTRENYIAETAKDRVRGVNRLNVYIRFGLLW